MTPASFWIPGRHSTSARPKRRGATDSAGCQSARNRETRKEDGRGSRGGSSAAGKTFILWCELVKQLPQLGPYVLQEVRVVAPIAPAPRNRKNSAIHHAELSQVLEHVRVFVILNTVANGLQANAWCGLGRPDRCRRIQEKSHALPT